MNRKIGLHAKAELIRLSWTVTLFPLIAILTCFALKYNWITPETPTPKFIASFLEFLLNINKLYVLLIILPCIALVFSLLIRRYDLKRVEKVKLRNILSFVLQKLLAAIRILAGACLGFWILNSFSDLKVITEFATWAWFFYFLFASVVISIYSRELLDIFLVRHQNK